jgi:PKD repeat protein
MKKILTAFTIIIITACNKQPIANFTTDKTEYEAGETINFKNTSQNGSTYIWTFPTGQSTSENPAYQISPTRGQGEIIINLQATSKNGKKSDQSERTLKVIPSANITFWSCQSCFGNPPIRVTINGVTKDITASYISNPPACGAPNCASFALVSGTYLYTATDNNGYSTNGNVVLAKGECRMISL